MMASLRSMTNQFRKWSRSARIWMVFLLFAIFVSVNFTESIRAFCQQYDVSCSIWLMPIALTKLNHRLWIMLLPVLLFCDAPFLDEQQPFIIIRIGRIRWAIGQILYIFAASALFYLICMAISIALIAPHVEFTLEWGKVLKTLAQSRASFGADMDMIPKAVLESYSPLQATVFCGGAVWLAVSFLGLLIFLCNLWMRRECGVILAGFFVGLSHFIELMGGVITKWCLLRFVSPVSWVNLEIVGKNMEESPSWKYVFAVGTALNIVLVIGILISVRHKSIETVKTF